MFPLNNDVRLENLLYDGHDDRLVFKTKTEEAVVVFTDTAIAEVTHRDLLNKTEVKLTPPSARHLVVGEKNWQRDVYHYLL